jgi:hypothetical protein
MIQPQALILVAVLTNPKDLEIARLLGWYRIPLRTAPKVVAVDFLAFYQTAAFGEERWQINYLAPVKGNELVTRADLFKEDVEHPRANDLYFKLQLGPLERLPAPIQAGKWKRITFFYTTGEYLNRSQVISDLIVQDAERETLWMALRERSQQWETQDEDWSGGFELDSETLAKIFGFHE